MNKSEAQVFLSLVQLFLPFFLPTLPRVSTAVAIAVSEDENVGVGSPFHISQCSTRAKLRVIAAQFHHSHLFCLLLICLFARVL